MIFQFANNIEQASTYHTGTPNYVDVSASFSATEGHEKFTDAETDNSWSDGDQLAIRVEQDATHVWVGVGTWDATNKYIEMDTQESGSIGTLTDSASVTVTATVTRGSLRLHAGRMRRSSTQSINSGSHTLIQLATADFDYGGITTVGSYRFDIIRDAVYQISFGAGFNGLSAGTQMAGTAYVNGTAIYRHASGACASTGDVSVSGSFPYELAAGDYVELRLYHNQGSAVNTSSFTHYQPWLGVTQLTYW